MSPERYLIVRVAAIGDVVMASSVARRLREERPGAWISWLCGSAIASLVEQFEDVDEVIPIDERRLLKGRAVDRLRVLVPLWRRLPRDRFTRVFLLHADVRYRVLTAPLVGVRVTKLSRRDAHGAMNPIPGRYLGDEYARLVDGLGHRGPIVGHYPLAKLKHDPARVLAKTDDRPRVALVPGGTRNVLRESVLKRWPIENYAALARGLAADGCEIVLVGDAGDDWVRPQFADIPTTDIIGRASLPETLRQLGGCDLVISHDTGPMHLARLARVPVLALFGPTTPSQFVIDDDLTTVLWGGEHLACRPCYDGREFADCRDNQCMSSIAADIVLRTARTLIQRRTGATPGRPAPQTPNETAAH